MTAFTLPSLQSAISRIWAPLRWYALAVLASVSFAAGAAEIRVKSAALLPGENAYVLDAEFAVDLGPILEDVVSRGVALYLVVEFELSRARWYWIDEHITGRILTYRLSYHALTRQYRLSTGALHQNFATLDEALRVAARLRRWPVADKALMRPGEVYNAALRMKLDLTQLPKPFQVTAIVNKDWNPGAETRRWSFVAGETPAQ